MKTIYFTPETIDEQAKNLQNRIIKHVCQRNYKIQKNQIAVLIIDMQKFFVDEDSHAFTPTIIPVVSQINLLLDSCKNNNIPVILTRHLSYDKDTGSMKRWWSDSIKSDNPHSAVTDLINKNGAFILTKSQYDAFYQTELEDYLRSKGIIQLIICGVLTHLCCETTARNAFIRGFEVFFPVDGTATHNEEFHIASLLNLAHGFAHIPTISDLRAIL
ncbi:MAG: isochorismatase family protein [Planctomycetes bacterium]|nr:isochorismatase family protein [Planctomycetota bacterium]